jgi:hypothetical protein
MQIENVADLIAETLIQAGVKRTPRSGRRLAYVRCRLSEAATYRAPIIQEERQKDKSRQE